MEDLEDLEQQLARGETPEDEQLRALSGLEGDALIAFTMRWRSLPVGVRGSLVEALDRLAAEDLVVDFRAVGALAVGDEDASIRVHGVYLLATEAEPASLDACLALATRDHDPEVRIAALDALGAYTLAAQADDWPVRLQDRLAEALLGALRAPGASSIARRAALLSVSYLTTPEVEAEIRRAYADPNTQETALEAMGRNCQETWIPDVVAALGAQDEELRLQAVIAAGEIEDERLVPGLIQRLDDRDEEVRFASIEALGTIGGQDARDALTQLTDSADPEVREAAELALDEAYFKDNPLGIDDDRGN